MKKLLFVLLLLLINMPILAQEKEHEVTSEVKELSEFHDVIYQIWHTAWPEKNTVLLKSFVGDVQKGYDKIAKAQLPGILRDKKPKWEEGLKVLGASVAAYKEASEKDNAQAFLDAAEKLHANYEGMVRIVKPVLKEVDAFHQELYMLYHYHSPNFDIPKIKATAEVMKVKMADLMNAKLTKKLEPRQEKFDSARNELQAAVLKLNEIAAKSKDKKEITGAVDNLHSKYEALESVFN